MPTEKKYDYVAGIAELVTQMTKPVEIGFGVIPEYNCTYCGAHIKNVYFIRDSNGGRWDVGSECVKVFAKYLGMAPGSIEKAIKFFEEYRELAKQAKVGPEAAKNLHELGQKVQDLQKKLAEEGFAKQKEQAKVLDTLDALDRIGALSIWEKEFKFSLRSQLAFHSLSSRQMEIANKIATRSPEEVAKLKAQNEVETKVYVADQELMTKLRHVNSGMYDREFIRSLYTWVFDNPRKSLSERQRVAALKLAEKYRKQIEEYTREYPNWTQ